MAAVRQSFSALAVSAAMLLEASVIASPVPAPERVSTTSGLGLPQADTTARVQPAAPVSAPETAAAATSPVVASAPTPAPTAVSIPTDLNPRPLGFVKQKPEQKKAATSTDPTTTSNSAFGVLTANPVVRTMLSLGLVVGIILLCAALFKKFGTRVGGLRAAMGAAGSSPSGILEILGRYPISRGQTLILLKLDRRVLLLSQTTPRIRGGTGTLTTLAEITEPEDVASILMKAMDSDGASTAAKFQSMLGRFDSAHHEPEQEHATQFSLREVQETEEGDRTELWDEKAAAKTFPIMQPLTEPRDSFGSIRQRLNALNGEAHR